MPPQEKRKEKKMKLTSLHPRIEQTVPKIQW